MSTLDRARERLERALQQLETAVRDRARPAAAAPGSPAATSASGEPSAKEAMLTRDLELLRAECDGLRRSLDEAQTRNRALADTVGQVTGQLDRTIGELADIVEG
jgi:hypothetical protein